MDARHRDRILRLLRTDPVVEAFARAAAAVPVHLVGGALRDRLLGLETHDLDLVVAGDGLRIARDAARRLGARLVDLGGDAFAAWRLVGAGWEADLWDRRGSSLHDDLARRDFTVNSFAMDLADGRLADPFGGVRDLELRRLGATTSRSFDSDPLRILRLPRLLLQLPGFTADPATIALARRSSAAIGDVATERVREELSRILASPEAGRGVTLLHQLDLYPGLFLGHPGTTGPLAAASADLLRLEGLSIALRDAIEGSSVPEPDLLAARWALLFRALAGGGRGGADALAGFSSRGYLARRIARAATLLLRVEHVAEDERSRRLFLHHAGDLWPTALLVLGVAAHDRQRWLASASAVGRLAKRHGAMIFDPPTLIDGNDLQAELLLDPGPQLGSLLSAVRGAQVEGTIATRDEALELARRLVT